MTSETINGTRYHIERRGPDTAPPLLMIAGLASDARSWMPVTPLLAQSFHLIMPDNHATPRTQSPDGKINLMGMADDYAELVSRIGGGGPVHVLGHSMGAMVALDMAARHAHTVDRLVLAAAGVKVAAPIRHVLRDLAEARFNLAADNQDGAPAELWFRLLFPWLFAPAFFEDERNVIGAAQVAAAMPDAQTPAQFAAQVAAVNAIDYSDRPAQVAQRTLVLNGKHDRFQAGYDRAEPFRAMAGASFALLGEAAHSLHWDQPKAFAETVSQFLTA